MNFARETFVFRLFDLPGIASNPQRELCGFVYCALCEHMPKPVEGIATQLLLLLNCARERNRQHDKPPEHLPPSYWLYSTSFPLAQTLPKSNDSQVKVETRRICNTLRRASQGVESTHTHTHTPAWCVPRRYSTQRQPVYHKRGEVFVLLWNTWTRATKVHECPMSSDRDERKSALF